MYGSSMYLTMKSIMCNTMMFHDNIIVKYLIELRLKKPYPLNTKYADNQKMVSTRYFGKVFRHFWKNYYIWIDSMVGGLD